MGLDGRLVTVRASKGMADLARLLGSPGREIHCLELMGGGVVEAGTGEVLDAEARRAYETRVRELQEQLDEAEADNDWARAERAREELDLLVDHLTAALGLGGRVRATGSTVERARSAVTQRIRTTIRRLESMQPPLGRHLAAAIHTGTFCVYTPEAPTEWDL